MRAVAAATTVAPLRVRSFRLLFLSTAVSSLGTLLATVALAIDVEGRTGSGLWVGSLMIVEFLPTVAVGLLLGPLLDRLSRRRLMVAADLVRAATFCALPFAPGAGAIVGLAAVAGLANGFFRPAAYASVPNLVADEQLAHANGLVQGVENLSWTVAPIAGGILAAAAGPDTAYWINAGSFLVSAALIAGIPARMLQSALALGQGHWSDLRAGFDAVRRSRLLVAVLAAWSVGMLAMGLTNVLTIFLAKDALHGGDLGYGVLFGSSGGGLVVGSLAGGWLVSALGTRAAYTGGIAAMGIGFAGAAASPGVGVAVPCFVLAGIGNGLAGICNVLLVQRGAADAVRGRALTLVMGVTYLAMAVGMAVAGPLLGALGVRASIGVAAAVLGLAAATALALAPDVPAAAAAAEAEADLDSRRAAGI